MGVLVVVVVLSALTSQFAQWIVWIVWIVDTDTLHSVSVMHNAKHAACGPSQWHRHTIHFSQIIGINY